MTLVVAKITKEFEQYVDLDISYEGKEFHFDAMQNYWHNVNFGFKSDLDVTEFGPATKQYFRVYDDDGIAYYEGWLLNDDECITQQFVLAWAMANDGATTIKIKKNGKWVQEIG